jgi:archaellum component FlaG (FlaF/FlaG flagellin family)
MNLKMPSIKSSIRLLSLLLLSATLFAIPTNAQSVSPSISGPSICVASSTACPASIENVPGSTISVAVVLNNTQQLNGFRITVSYNSTELNALHVRTGTWASGTCAPVPCQVLPVFNQTLQLAGTITVAQVLLGSTTNITSASLITVDFGIKNFGSSDISLTSVALTGLVNGQITLLPVPPTFNGHMFTPPPVTTTFVKSGLSVAVHHLKLSSGNVQTLSGIVSNTGTTTAQVRIDYVIVSDAGDVSFVSTGVLTMPAGTTGTLSVSYTVPSLPLKYHVIGNLQESGDGIFYIFSGSSDTTAYSVVP